MVITEGDVPSYRIYSQNMGNRFMICLKRNFCETPNFNYCTSTKST